MKVGGSGFRFEGWGLRVEGSGFRVQGSGFMVQGSGFMVQGSGFRFQGSGFRDHYLDLADDEGEEGEEVQKHLPLEQIRRPEVPAQSERERE